MGKKGSDIVAAADGEFDDGGAQVARVVSERRRADPGAYSTKVDLDMLLCCTVSSPASSSTSRASSIS